MSCWKEVLKYKTLATWNLSTQIIILEIQNYVAQIALCTLLCTSLSTNSINLHFYIVLLFILFNTFHYCLFERRTHGIKIVFSMDSVTINYSPMRLECCYTTIILFGFSNGQTVNLCYLFAINTTETLYSIHNNEIGKCLEYLQDYAIPPI